MPNGEPLTRIEQNRLLAQFVVLLPGRSLLPPPTTIRLRHAWRGSRITFEVTVASSPSRGSAGDEYCEITGCLDPLLTPDRSMDVTLFREWAISAPEHPLAIRYQPLSAWLQAAGRDPRFLGLADRFVREERSRLRSQIIAAAERLSRRDSEILRRRTRLPETRLFNAADSQ